MSAGIPPEAILAAITTMTEARDAIDRADPLNCAIPNGLSARLSDSIGQLRGHLICNLPERLQLRAA